MFKKTMRLLFAGMTTTLLVLPPASFAIEPGKWEITSQVEMTGMPMQMPPVKNVQCLTDSTPAPTQAGADASEGSCRMSDIKTEGDTVTWTMECDSDGAKVKGKGKITYHGATFDGTMNTVMDQGGQTMEIVTRLNGKRLGACDK